MKSQIMLPACVLLLWTLTAFVTGDGAADIKVNVITVPEGVKLECTGDSHIKDKENVSSVFLRYEDESSGEYTCEKDEKEVKIFVKFRTCDNCIELDPGSLVGIAVGDVVATTAIGVAVYLIASRIKSGPIKSYKNPAAKPRAPNEGGSRGPSEHYEPLRSRGQKDTYDMIKNRRP